MNLNPISLKMWRKPSVWLNINLNKICILFTLCVFFLWYLHLIAFDSFVGRFFHDKNILHLGRDKRTDIAQQQTHI